MGASTAIIPYNTIVLLKISFGAKEREKTMERSEILTHCDHTLLKQDATWEQVRDLCDEGLRHHTASVCIPPSFVKRAAAYLAGRLPVCTVIGFPNGYATTVVKVFETAQAVAEGADEIDMVINVGMVKEKQWAALLEEIQQVRKACPEKVLKVIVETCLLTQEEKVAMCEIVARSGADFIKTSTGFSTGGATREDVILFRQNLPARVKIKASGGIRTHKDAEALLHLGAARLGASALVRDE